MTDSSWQACLSLDVGGRLVPIFKSNLCNRLNICSYWGDIGFLGDSYGSYLFRLRSLSISTPSLMPHIWRGWICVILSYFVLEGAGSRVNRTRVQILGQGSRLVLRLCYLLFMAVWLWPKSLASLCLKQMSSIIVSN